MTRVRGSGLAVVALLVCSALTPTAADAASTAYRMTSLALRDPHLFVTVVFCLDVTNTPIAGYSVNGQIQTAISNDSDGDGLLDLNELIVFDPLDQTGTGGTLKLVAADCTAPSAGTYCQLGGSAPLALPYLNQPTGACLAPIAGTTFTYSPAIVSPTNNCFASSAATLSLNLSGIPLTLRDARIGGVYNTVPATSIVNGLLMGFLSETDATATLIPAAIPVIGGKTLASLLPGGAGNCSSHSDKDSNGGIPGWWFYLNFTATQVPYNDGTTAVEVTTPLDARLSDARPNPFRESVALDYSLPVASVVRAWVTDLGGRRIATLEEGIRSPGAHTIEWDGRDASGAREAAGVYFIRVEAMGRTSTRRVALLR